MRIRHLRFTLSTLALSAGALILGISLSQSSQPAFSATGSFDATQRKLYFDSVLPDHVAYPVLMALDRVKLESATPTEQVHLKVSYGQRRLDYSEALLAKGNQALALSTLTKSIKYMVLAGHQVLEEDLPASLRQFVDHAIEFHKKEVHSLRNQFGDAERANLDHLLSELEVIQSQLQTEPATQPIPATSSTPVSSAQPDQL